MLNVDFIDSELAVRQSDSAPTCEKPTVITSPVLPAASVSPDAASLAASVSLPAGAAVSLAPDEPQPANTAATIATDNNTPKNLFFINSSPPSYETISILYEKHTVFP